MHAHANVGVYFRAFSARFSVLFAFVCAAFVGEAAAQAVTIAPDAREIGAGKTLYGVAVDTAAAWTVSKTADWVSVSPASGTLEGTVEITAEPNTTGAARTTTITIGGQAHTLTQKAASAVSRDLWGVGQDHYGALGAGMVLVRKSPVEVASGVAAVAPYYNHTLILKTDGTLWGTGANPDGRLGIGTYTSRGTFGQIMSGVTSMAVGTAHSLFIRADGTLWGMGNNGTGQLLTNTTINVGPYPGQISLGTGKITAVAAGEYHSLCLKEDGTLWAAGNNSSGQLGNGTTTNQTAPVQVASSVKAVFARFSVSCFIKTDGTLWVMGENGSGQLGNGTTTNQTTPVQVATNVASVAVGLVHTLILKTDGTVWAMGSNSGGQIGNGVTGSQTSPVQIMTGVTAVAAGAQHSLFLKTDGTVWATGSNFQGQLGNGTTVYQMAPVQVLADVAGVGAGSQMSFFIKNGGKLLACGQAMEGQLGDGAKVVRTTPIESAVNVQSAASGYFGMTMFLKTDGTLWATGCNGYGQLGNGNTRHVSIPVQVDTGVVSYAMGDQFALYVKSDGTVWAVGTNKSGQFGNGTTGTSQTTPLQVGTGAVAVAAGNLHVAILKSDGTLWSSGYNNCGQLGTGNTTSISTAVQVATGVQSVAANFYHTLFIKTDGTLWGIGNNANGQLGNGNTTNQTLPIQIATGVAKAWAGYYHSIFLKTDGTMWAMGNNGNGRLGDGSTTQRTSPVQIKLTDVVEASAGCEHSAFLRSDGTLWTVGRNHYGQLGDGTTVNRSYVALIARNVASVNANAFSTLYVTTGDSNVAQPTITTQPVDQTPAAGTPVTFSVAAAAGTPSSVSYQWYFNDAAISGATNATYMIANPTYANAGNYRVTVLNGVLAPVTSKTVRLDGTNLPPVLSPTTKEVGYGLVTYGLRIEAGGAWTATASADWVKLSKASGTGTDYIDVVVGDNTTGSSRTATVTIGGVTHTITQRATGTTTLDLWGVGNDNAGMLGQNRIVCRTAPYAMATGVVKVASGNATSFYLKSDGTLWAMGLNSNGQLGDGSYLNRTVPTQIATGVSDVSSGMYHTLVLKTDGTLWTTGYNYYGQLGTGNTSIRSTLYQAATGVKAIAAGWYHSLYLKMDGTLWGMGNGTSGQLGDGAAVDRYRPVQIASNVAAMAAGNGHSLFVKTDGTLWGVGYNNNGQLGDGTTTQRNTPVYIGSGYSQVAAGNLYSLFLGTDGRLLGVGNNGSGRLGDGTQNQSLFPVLVASDVVKMVAADSHSAFIKTDGTAWAMGNNYGGQLGDFTMTNRFSPVQVMSDVVAISASWRNTLFLKNGGALYGVGNRTYGQLGDDIDFVSRVPVLMASGIQDGVKAIAAGSNHSFWISEDGTLWASGDNVYGQLGDGTTTMRTMPVAVMSGVATAAAGEAHSLVLKTDGTLWVTGSNGSGQLGNGTYNNRSAFQQIATGVAAVAAARNHSFFVKTDRTLWAMGDNSYGQLGDGTTTTRTAPVQVATDVMTVATGQYTAYYVKSDGTLWAMGRNHYGQLGDGTTTTRPTPVQIAMGVLATGEPAVAAGTAHAVYLLADRSVYGMGYNYYGQLGDGTTEAKSSPVHLFGGGVRSIAAGGSFTALMVDGTLYTAGYNSYGQLADGAIGSRPKFIAVAMGVRAVAAGFNHLLFTALGDIRVNKSAPTVTSISSTTIATSMPVTITGTGLMPVKNVLFGGVPATAYTCEFDGSITAQVPSGVPATGVVTVITQNGTATSSQSFAYTTKPLITEIIPSSGPVRTAVRVNGYNLSLSWTGTEEPTVSFNGTNASRYPTRWSTAGSYFMISVPAGATTGPITVKNDSGTGTSTIPFTVTTGSAPANDWCVNAMLIGGETGSVSGSTFYGTRETGEPVNPGSAGGSTMWYSWTAPTTGYVQFTAAGAIFGCQLGVYTGIEVDKLTTVATAFNAYSNATASFAVTAGTNYHISVDGFDGINQDYVLSWAAYSSVPTITSFTPSSGNVGTAVYISGAGFTADSVVKFNGTTATGLIISGTDYIQVGVPAGATTGVITVTTPFGTATSSLPFTVTNVAAPTITVQPVGVTINAGQNAVFSVVATGEGTLTYQWQTQEPGTSVWVDAGESGLFQGVHTATLTVVNMTQTGWKFRCKVSNAGSTVYSGDATLTVNAVPVAPTITTQPVSQAVAEGATVNFTVEASGSPTPTYVWKKDGVVLTGNTGATLTLTSVTLASSGNYTVTVSNTAGSVTSSAAKLTVIPTGVEATHSSIGYQPGGTATVTTTISHNGQVNALGIDAVLPAGWSYASGTNEGEVKPTVGDTETLGWNYTTVPASPITFTYTMNVPAGQAGDKTIATVITMGFVSGSTIQFTVKPDPLVLKPATYHSCDTGKDWKIGVSELTRVIQLYNTRNGTTRTGAYLVQDGTADGFNPEPTRLTTDTVTLPRYHSADYGKDGKISVSELTRVIQLYNYRSGTTRTGEYHVTRTGESTSLDGFSPGP